MILPEFVKGQKNTNLFNETNKYNSQLTQLFAWKNV